MTTRILRLKTIVYLFCFTLLPGIYSQIAAANPEVMIEPTPGWVNKAKVELNTNNIHEHLPNGEYFLLVDRQINTLVELHEYNHFAIELNTSTAIENNSQLSFTFSPSYQILQIHEIKILRNNKSINQLNKDKIKLLQRETELEKLIIDGEWTATIILDDIRKGDILEYSYSRIGQNKALDNHYSTSFNLEWTVPVYQLFYRLLWPNNRKLVETPVNTNLSFRKNNSSRHIEYLYHQYNVAGLDLETQYPEWYLPWKRINFSDTSNWKDIIQWLKPKYQPPITLSPDLRDIVSKLKKQHNTKSQQASAALHFVQDEIRYLGIEIGSRGFNPNAPDETLNQRYGDCKDKTLLLITLLDALGIEAYPALVNTEHGEILNHDGPRINAFDHVLVKAVIDNKSYWLDPTITLQKGDLGQFYQPDYGFALVIGDNQQDLTKMSTSSDEHKIEITETFDLRAGVNKPSTYSITSVYKGLDAENFRRNLISKGSKKLEKEYLDYYSRYYPTLESKSSLSIKDIEDTNQIITEEKYHIQNTWTDNIQDKQYEFDIYSEAIYTYLKTPETRNRTAPFKYIYPANTKQTIHVLLPEKWNIKTKSTEIDTPFLKFNRSVLYDNSKLQLTLIYQIESKVKHIKTDDIDTYIATIQKIKNEMDYGLTYTYQATTQQERMLTTPRAGFLEMYESEIIIGIFILLFILLIYSIIEYRSEKIVTSQKLDNILYPVNPAKFVILSIITFNIYNIFWFYKNWAHIKLKESANIMPWARALFHSIWYFPLYKHIHTKYNTKKHGYKLVIYALIAIAYFTLFFLSNTELTYDYIDIITIAICVLPLVLLINTLNGKSSDAYKYNSKWRPRHLALFAIFTIISIFHIATDNHSIPGDSLVEGKALWQNDINYIENTNLIPYNEKIVFLYSDGFLTYKNSGIGFTNNRVFSYSRNNNDQKLEFNYAEYQNISDIKHKPSHIYDKGEITITLNDNSDFSLIISTNNKSDEIFYNTLKSTWKDNKQQYDEMGKKKKHVINAIKKIRSIFHNS